MRKPALVANNRLQVSLPIGLTVLGGSLATCGMTLPDATSTTEVEVSGYESVPLLTGAFPTSGYRPPRPSASEIPLKLSPSSVDRKSHRIGNQENRNMKILHTRGLPHAD